MRQYNIFFIKGEADLVCSKVSTSRNAIKHLKNYNQNEIFEKMKADRCVVYTASMSRIADVRLVKREGLPDAYVYYPI